MLFYYYTVRYVSHAPEGPYLPLVSTRARGDPTNLSLVLSPYQTVKTVDILVCFDFLTAQNHLYLRTRRWLTAQLNRTHRLTTVLQTPAHVDADDDDGFGTDEESDDDSDDCDGLGSTVDYDHQYVGNVDDFAVIDNRQVVAEGKVDDPDYLKGQRVLRFYIGRIVSKNETTVMCSILSLCAILSKAVFSRKCRPSLLVLLLFIISYR